MKKYLLISAVLLAFSCQQNPQKKAEAMVKSYLDSTLSNPKSYQGIKFSNIKATGVFYTIKHTFSHANSYNAIIIDSGTFVMDNRFTKIVESY